MSKIQATDITANITISTSVPYPTKPNDSSSTTEENISNSELAKLLSLVIKILEALLGRISNASQYVANASLNDDLAMKYVENNYKAKTSTARQSPSTLIMQYSPLRTTETPREFNNNPFLYRELCNTLIINHDDPINEDNRRADNYSRTQKEIDDQQWAMQQDNIEQSQKARRKHKPRFQEIVKKTTFEKIGDPSMGEDSKTTELSPFRKVTTITNTQGDITIVGETEYTYQKETTKKVSE